MLKMGSILRSISKMNRSLGRSNKLCGATSISHLLSAPPKDSVKDDPAAAAATQPQHGFSLPSIPFASERDLEDELSPMFLLFCSPPTFRQDLQDHEEARQEDEAEQVRSFPPHPTINWLDKGVLHPIQNQETTGLCRNGKPDSCATFSGEAIFEGELKNGGAEELNKYSEQNMEDCLYHQPQNFKGSEFGGQIFFVFQYLMKKGLSLARDYPNTGSHKQFYEDKVRELSTTIADYRVLIPEGEEHGSFTASLVEGRAVTFPKNDDAALVKAASEGLIGVCLHISHSELRGYSGEQAYDGHRPKEGGIYHGMVIVGLINNQWILRNHYGPKWGISG